MPWTKSPRAEQLSFWEKNVSESEQVEAPTSVRAQKTLKVAKLKRDVSPDRRVQF